MQFHGWWKEAPCHIHFTSFVKWVGNHEFNPAETVKMPYANWMRDAE